MIYLVEDTLANRVCSTGKDNSRQEEKLTTYGQVMNYPLNNCAIRSVIAKTKAGISHLERTEGMSAVRHAYLLWEMALHCCLVYDVSRLKEVCIENLRKSLRFSIKIYWAVSKDASLQNLLGPATSPSMLHKGSRSSGTPRNSNVNIRERHN